MIILIIIIIIVVMIIIIYLSSWKKPVYINYHFFKKNILIWSWKPKVTLW